MLVVTPQSVPSNRPSSLVFSQTSISKCPIHPTTHQKYINAKTEDLPSESIKMVGWCCWYTAICLLLRWPSHMRPGPWLLLRLPEGPELVSIFGCISGSDDQKWVELGSNEVVSLTHDKKVHCCRIREPHNVGLWCGRVKPDPYWAGEVLHGAFSWAKLTINSWALTWKSLLNGKSMQPQGVNCLCLWMGGPIVDHGMINYDYLTITMTIHHRFNHWCCL